LLAEERFFQYNLSLDGSVKQLHQGFIADLQEPNPDSFFA
jgi:hypothetical protein